MFVYRTLLSVSNIIGLGTFSVWGGYCWTFSLEEDFFSSLEFGWKVRFFLLDFRELDFRELDFRELDFFTTELDLKKVPL